jgi:hypothetical protein
MLDSAVLEAVKRPAWAFVADDNPSAVYVCEGPFCAIRVDGAWKPASGYTEGELDAGFTRLTAPGEVDALVKAARTSLSETPVRVLVGSADRS